MFIAGFSGEQGPYHSVGDFAVSNILLILG